MESGDLWPNAKHLSNVVLKTVLRCQQDKYFFSHFIKAVTMRVFSKFLEILDLNLCFLKITAKSLVISLKLLRSKFRCRKLLLQRSILIISKRDALLEYRRRAMFVNELFKTVKQSHKWLPIP